MNHDDDDALVGVALDAWRVPPPPAADAPAILRRALAPAAAPARSRIKWLVAGLAMANIALAVIVVILGLRRPPPPVMVAAGGGGQLDAKTQQLLDRIDQQQRELDSKLAEMQKLRTSIEALSERLLECERPAKTPAPTPPRPAPTPPSPTETPSPAPVPPGLGDSLDRVAIVAAIDAVKPQVQACGQRSTASGVVKLTVRVSPAGSPTNVVVASTPDAALGACVAGAVQKAKFAATKSGGTFSYPFRFAAR